MMFECRRRRCAFLFFTLCAFSPSTMSQSSDGPAYPTRAIRLVVPFPAGASPNDTIGRLIGRYVSDSIGQQIIVDNRSGAGGTIGTDLVAKANPDGYTILITSISLTTSPNVYKNMPYDVARDLQAVTMIASTAALVFVNLSVPANTVKEFIAYAKSRPGQINFGSGGNGTYPHFAAEMINSLAGIKMTHVPYKGGAPAIAALLGGEISLYIDAPIAALQFYQQGKLKVLAVTEKTRLAALPDVPTLDEAGVPGYELRFWNGFFAPAKTPKFAVEKLYSETAKVLRLEEVKSRLALIGTAPVGNRPEVFQAMVQSELTKFAKLAAEVGIKPE